MILGPTKFPCLCCFSLRCLGRNSRTSGPSSRGSSRNVAQPPCLWDLHGQGIWPISNWNPKLNSLNEIFQTPWICWPLSACGSLMNQITQDHTGPYLYMLLTFNKDRSIQTFVKGRSMGHRLGICFAWEIFYVWNSSWSQQLKNLRFRVHSATSYFSFKLTLAQRPKGKIRIYIASVLPLSCMPKHFWLFLLKKHLSAKYFIFCKSKFQCLRTRSPSKSSSRN